jgi:hypothetical protein
MSDKGSLRLRRLQTTSSDSAALCCLRYRLMLTVSAQFLAGSGFQFIGMAHAATVIALLLYLPFGKLFHIIQRPLSLGVSFYKQAGEGSGGANCRRCGAEYASRLQIDDLKTVLDQVGFNFRFATPSGELHYQESVLRAGDACLR